MRAGRFSHWNTRNLGSVTLSVRPRPKTPYTVLRVDNLIDTGRKGKTAILSNALPDFLEIDINPPGRDRVRVCLPRTLGDMKCTYTGRRFGIVADVVESLQAVVGTAKLAAVCPDVLRPGDFVLYRHGKNGMRFSGVLRPVPLAGKEKSIKAKTKE